jgi:hypothetical protein
VPLVSKSNSQDNEVDTMQESDAKEAELNEAKLKAAENEI